LPCWLSIPVGSGLEDARGGIGSAKRLGTANFNFLLSAIFKEFERSKRHGKTRKPSQTRLDVWRD